NGGTHFGYGYWGCFNSVVADEDFIPKVAVLCCNLTFTQASLARVFPKGITFASLGVPFWGRLQTNIKPDSLCEFVLSFIDLHSSELGSGFPPKGITFSSLGVPFWGRLQTNIKPDSLCEFVLSFIDLHSSELGSVYKRQNPAVAGL